MTNDNDKERVATQRTTFTNGNEHPKNCPGCGAFLRKKVFRKDRWDKTAHYTCENCGFSERVEVREDR